MRQMLVVALVGLTGLATPAIAQIPNTLMSGTIQKAIAGAAGGFCLIDGGASDFHFGAFDSSVMTFGQILVWSSSRANTSGYSLGGQVQLNFSSGSTGYMKFTNNPAIPSTVAEPQFSNYSQVYHTQSQKLTVSFNILFPGCTLPISATYQN